MRTVYLKSMLFTYNYGRRDLTFFILGTSNFIEFRKPETNADGYWLYENEFDYETSLPYLVPCLEAGITGLTEEELFQQSVVWDYEVDFDMLIAIQKYCYSVIHDDFMVHQLANNHEILLELEY